MQRIAYFFPALGNAVKHRQGTCSFNYTHLTFKSPVSTRGVVCVR